MPKQIIVEAGRDFPLQATGWLDTSYVRVGWDKEFKKINIATVFPGGKLRTRYTSDDGMTGGWKDVDTQIPGWFVELDEDRLDELIDALKRARKQLFT